MAVIDVIECPGCQQEVSRRAVECPSCGAHVSDVPAAITLELIDGLRDLDLPDVLFRYALDFLEQHGCSFEDGTSDREVLATLPRGIRAAYSLVVLDSEVRNGGFYQWFTNQSGRIADLALEDLYLIGAADHIALVGDAVSLNRQLELKYPWYECRYDHSDDVPGRELVEQFGEDVEANFEPVFERLTTAFFNLEESDSLWLRFVEFVRRNPRSSLHDRCKS